MEEENVTINNCYDTGYSYLPNQMHEFKRHLENYGYKVTDLNSGLATSHSILSFTGMPKHCFAVDLTVNDTKARVNILMERRFDTDCDVAILRSWVHFKDFRDDIRDHMRFYEKLNSIVPGSVPFLWLVILKRSTN